MLGNWKPSKSTLKAWIANSKKTLKVSNLTPKGRKGCKITEEVILCVITTLMDYLQWTGIQRTEYLNLRSGIFEKGSGISVRSVNRLISQLHFRAKSIKCFPPARNTIGLMILRAFWASIVLEIAQLSNVLFMFVDEAAVTLLPNTIKGRALIGVVPAVEGILAQHKLSILSCVIPGFGVISR
ncbi:uncharacterized protein GO595_001552 [Histomonas meleagridis]|uniref:uncharacterized protein n=1 Tax=Histomonas meleagridis TaxID=135588 RepID=UPI003559CDAD|nr:hypothetical protein GO595_001552 [Histomonas meleagridis]